MSSPFFFEQSVRHYHEELKRNERRAQHLAELKLAQAHQLPRFARVRELIAHAPRLRPTRSAGEAYS
jgi:hypothetical protein